MSDHDTAVETVEERYATDDISRPYWAALAAGRLDLPRCTECDACFFFPRRVCPTCHSDSIEWVESPGVGTVFACSEVHVAFQGISKDELPYWVGLVDLDEGVRVPGRLADATIGIGDRVQLRFAADPRHELPRFAKVD